MKINERVVIDIPSKSIEDDIVDTIRYRAARDQKQSKFKDCYNTTIRYFKVIRKLNTHSNTPAYVRVNNLNGFPVGSYFSIYSIKKRGTNNMSKHTLEWRRFNGYRYKNESLR